MQRSGWAAGTALMFSAVSMGVGFFTTPLLVRTLGADRFGAFRLLNDWFAYLTLLDLGIVGAIIGCMAPAVGRGDQERVKGWLTAGLRAYAGLAAGMIAAGMILTFLMPTLIKGNLPAEEITAAALLLLIPLAMMPLYVFRAVVELSQFIHLTNIILIGQALLTAALSVGAAYLGWGLVGQALAVVVAQLPGPILLTVKAINLYPRFWEVQLSRSDRKAMWNLNWKTLVFRATSQISVLSDAIILGWIRGAASVTALLITQRLSSILRNQIQSLSNSVWPGLLELHARGEMAAFRARMMELTRLTSSLSMIGLGVVGVYNAEFVGVWVGQQHYSGAAVNIISSINFGLWSIFGLWHWPIAGTGNIGAWTPYAVLSTLLNLVLSVVCTYWLGPPGPLLGTLASFVLIYSWAVPKVLRELFGIDPKELWYNAVIPGRIYVPYLCIVGWVAHNSRPDTYLALLTHLGAATMAGLALWWLFDLDSNSREQWKTRFELVFARPRVSRQLAEADVS